MSSGLVLSQLLVDLRLKFPDAAESLRVILEPFNLNFAISDKGALTAETVRLWGSLAQVSEDLRNPRIEALLANWVQKANQTSRAYGIVANGRRYMRLHDVMRITKLTVKDSRNILDRYIERDVVTRGVLLKCNRCLSNNFIGRESSGQILYVLDVEILRVSWVPIGKVLGSQIGFTSSTKLFSNA